MAITHAVQSGGTVKVYDNTKVLFVKNGKLMGYTSGSVTIEGSSYIETYNETGRRIAAQNK